MPGKRQLRSPSLSARAAASSIDGTALVGILFLVMGLLVLFELLAG